MRTELCEMIWGELYPVMTLAELVVERNADQFRFAATPYLEGAKRAVHFGEEVQESAEPPFVFVSPAMASLLEGAEDEDELADLMCHIPVIVLPDYVGELAGPGMGVLTATEI